MRRFYFCSHDRVGDKVMLEEREARHLSVVIRAKVGQSVVLFNEKGEEFVASVVRIGPRQVELSIKEKKGMSPGSLANLHLCMALVKGKALEKALSSTTELGVGKIIVVPCERSVPSIRLSDIEKKLARWKRILLSAAKQCGRAVSPDIEYLSGWDKLLERMGHYGRVFIALGSGSREPFSVDPGEDVLVIVGPEGGFTDAEESAALEGGALPLSLAPFTLRSDTAAIAALSLLISAFSDKLGAKR